jgi:hypothetical protein
MSAMKTSLETELEGAQIASGLIPAANINGDDDLDTKLLREMSEDARRYISSFSWCEAVTDSYFGGGVGGIFAVFFFHIRPGRHGVDSWIWTMVGDIPSAYLPLADSHSPAEAFETYIRGMRKWVELARKGKTGNTRQGVPPVSVPATPEWAEKLNKKLEGLILAIRPFFQVNDGKTTTVH